MKDGNSETHAAYAEALGSIVHNVVMNLSEQDDVDNVMDTIFTMIFTNLNVPSRVT